MSWKWKIRSVSTRFLQTQWVQIGRQVRETFVEISLVVWQILSFDFHAWLGHVLTHKADLSASSLVKVIKTIYLVFQRALNSHTVTLGKCNLQWDICLKQFKWFINFCSIFAVRSPKFHAWLSYSIYLLILCASTLNWLLSSVLNPPVEWWWWFTCLPRAIGRGGALHSDHRPSHVLPHPSLARQTRFLLFPFRSAEHQVHLGMVPSYLSLHPFQPFSLCWGWSVGIGEAMRQDIQNDRARGWVGTRWEIHPKKPQGLPVHPLQEREEIFLLSSSWAISMEWGWVFKDWREWYQDCGSQRCLASWVTSGLQRWLLGPGKLVTCSH